MWLRQLTSLDAAVRRTALNHLAGSICHQGWICPASAYAVPYLLELVSEPSVLDRDQILDLLADIAAADPLPERPWRVNERIPQYNVPLPIPFKDAHAAVASGRPLYLRLLDDVDPRIRMEAARVLASLPEYAPENRQHFLAVLDYEQDTRVRANLLLALRSVSRPVHEEWHILYERFLAREHALVTFAAALALSRLAHEETPQDVAEFLAAEMLSLREDLDGYKDLPCGGGYAWSAARWALYPLGWQRLRFLAPDLRDLLTRNLPHSVITTHSLAELLLFITFQGPPQDPQLPRTAESLTAGQRAALTDLLSVAELWKFGNFTQHLKSYGLPAKREEMATYLGHTLEDLPEHGPSGPAPSTPRRRDAFSKYAERIHEVAPDLRIQQMRGRVHSSGDLSDGVVTVNQRYLFRFPHQTTSAEALAREIALLRALQGRLPLNIPDPALSRDDIAAPRSVFMGCELLPGKPLEREMLESIFPEGAVSQVTAQLGAFLQALHTIPVEELALPLPLRAPSTEDWDELYAAVRTAIFPLVPTAARERIHARFEAFLANHQPVSPCLIHGRFSPQVILYDAKTRTLSGIIDFGHAALGDPAVDLAGLLGPMGYEERFMRQIEEAASSSADAGERARFYALASTLRALLPSGGDRPTVPEDVQHWLMRG